MSETVHIVYRAIVWAERHTVEEWKDEPTITVEQPRESHFISNRSAGKLMTEIRQSLLGLTDFPK